MTYKEKKMSIFNEVFAPSFKDFDFLMSVNQFIEETIDEILGCLPEKDTDGIFEVENTEISDNDYNNIFGIGYNYCLKNILQNLEEKAGEL
jgi:hypothetical protein